MLFYVIAYDISDDKRRKTISDILEGYGSRVQYSVFECVLSKPQFQELTKKLKRVFEEEEDSLRFYPISQHTSQNIIVWGVGNEVTPPPQSIII